MSRLSIFAATLLAVLSLAAPAGAQGDTPGAVAEAVQACRRFADEGAAPSAAFAGTRLTSAPTHAGLQGAFLKDVADTVWYSRALAPGRVLVAASRSVNSCKVFLEGAPGRAAIDKVVAEGVAGWKEQPTDPGTRIFYRRRPTGDLTVISLHLGPDTVSERQIGAMADVYVMPKS